jgi:hypothetical protein
MALISRDSCWGKVPDMGVMMGDEMLIPLASFLLGERREEKRAEVFDFDFSSLAAAKLRPAGLDLLFFDKRPLDLSDAVDSWGLGATTGDSRMIPFCFASSCSMTYLYISSSCCCAMALSAATTDWSTSGETPRVDGIADEEGDGMTYDDDPFL